jgi:hypothetical protein
VTKAAIESLEFAISGQEAMEAPAARDTGAQSLSEGFQRIEVE